MESRRPINATCPECRGPLTEVQDDGIVTYECLVGHRYSPDGLLRCHYDTEERTLWAAVVGLAETLELVRAVSPHMAPETARNLHQDAEDKVERANQVREILGSLKPYRLE
jgi:two-component system, chemotaxis family, protein-glutamate methylesterase/glutaminase